MRPLVAFASLVLSLSVLALVPSPAAATCESTGSPHTRVDSVAVETRDGAPWKSGDPVSVVVRMSRIDDDWAFPEEALAVVMRTDEERTKCLDVPLRKIGGSADQAVYAGVFYPFRAASYSAKLTVGGEAHDIAFTVGTAALAPQGSELGVAEVGRAGSPSEAAAFTAPSDPPVAPLLPAAAVGALAAAAIALASVALLRSRRRAPVAA